MRQRHRRGDGGGDGGGGGGGLQRQRQRRAWRSLESGGSGVVLNERLAARALVVVGREARVGPLGSAQRAEADADAASCTRARLLGRRRRGWHHSSNDARRSERSARVRAGRLARRMPVQERGPNARRRRKRRRLLVGLVRELLLFLLPRVALRERLLRASARVRVRRLARVLMRIALRVCRDRNVELSPVRRRRRPLRRRLQLGPLAVRGRRGHRHRLWLWLVLPEIGPRVGPVLQHGQMRGRRGQRRVAAAEAHQFRGGDRCAGRSWCLLLVAHRQRHPLRESAHTGCTERCQIERRFTGQNQRIRGNGSLRQSKRCDAMTMQICIKKCTSKLICN